MDEDFGLILYVYGKDNDLSIEVPPRPHRRLQQPTSMDEFVAMEKTEAQSNKEDFGDINNHYHISIYNTTQDHVIREFNQRRLS